MDLLPAEPPARQIAGWFDAVMILGRRITDRRAHAHDLRVARLCVQIGRQLSMSAKELRLLARAGLLHDQGKQQAPGAGGGWTGGQDHPDWRLEESGDMGLVTIERTGQSGRELRAILYQHERLHGSGYPYGLRGDAFPIEARILGVADAYDELTNERLNHQAMTVAQARRYFQSQAGSTFDPKVVAALSASIGARRRKTARTARRILAY